MEPWPIMRMVLPATSSLNPFGNTCTQPCKPTAANLVYSFPDIGPYQVDVDTLTYRLFGDVDGKAAGWRTLRALAQRDGRLDADRLDDLLARADRQSGELESLRVRTAERLLASETG